PIEYERARGQAAVLSRRCRYSAMAPVTTASASQIHGFVTPGAGCVGSGACPAFCALTSCGATVPVTENAFAGLEGATCFAVSACGLDVGAAAGAGGALAPPAVRSVLRSVPSGAAAPKAP